LDKKKTLLSCLVTPIILYGCEVWGGSISRQTWNKIEQIQKQFIIYNFNIKNNTIYPMFPMDVGLLSIESEALK